MIEMAKKCPKCGSTNYILTCQMLYRGLKGHCMDCGFRYDHDDNPKMRCKS